MRLRLAEIDRKASVESLIRTVVEAESLGHESSIESKSVVQDLMTRLLGGSAYLLLDGLDEVAEEAVEDVVRLIYLLDDLFPRALILVTCRTFDYRVGPTRQLPFTVMHLLPFSKEDQVSYVERWYTALGRLAPTAEVNHRRQTLESALKSRPYLSDMGRTPLLLALMALVHTQDGELPEARATLYRRIILHLLAESPVWREGYYSANLASQDLLLVAARVGYEFHVAQEATTREFRGLTEEQLSGIITGHFELYSATMPGTRARRELEARCVNYRERLTQSNGLLVPQGGGTYDFAFRQFREFLAGLYLARLVEDDETLELTTREHWRECFLLLANYAASADANPGYLVDFIVDMYMRATKTEQRTSRDWQYMILGGEMLCEMGRDRLVSVGLSRVVNGSASSHPRGGLWQRATQALLPGLSADTSLSAPMRVRAATTLGRLGDPRFYSDGNLKPPFTRMVGFPAKECPVGTSTPTRTGRPLVDTASTVRQVLAFDRFQIGLYPVTNAEYVEFMAGGGYEDEEWWVGREARLWRRGDRRFLHALERIWLRNAEEYYDKELQDGTYSRENLEDVAGTLFRPRLSPYFIDDSRFNAPTQPVVGVNFWEAEAYCRWLTHSLAEVGELPDGVHVRLPCE